MKTRKIVIIFIRIIIVILLILSLLNIQIPAGSKKICRLYLIDVSESISCGSSNLSPLDIALSFIKWDIQNLLPDDEVGVAVFTKDISFEIKPTKKSDFNIPEKLSANIKKDITDIPKAFLILFNFFPEGVGKEIFLFTDGNNITGDLKRAVVLAKLKDINIYTIPLGPREPNDFKIESVDSPSHILPGQKFEISVVVSSTVQGKAKVTLVESGISTEVALSKDAPIKVSFPDILYTSKEPYQNFTIKVSPIGIKDDCEQNNNTYTAVVKSDDKVKVLYLTQEPIKAPLANIVKSNPNIEIDITNVYKPPFAYQCLVLDNFPLLNLTKDEMAEIKSFVEDFGGGLLIAGGPNSFALGNYENTPVEEVSPVWAFPDERLSVAVVLDKSGSMGMDIAALGKKKINVAVDAIGTAINLLNDEDWLTITTFSGDFQTLIPITQLNQRDKIKAELNKVTAYGPTLVLPPLENAIKQLLSSKVTTSRRHIVLLTDGKSNEEKEKFIELGKKIKNKNITITIIATGEDVEEDKLKALIGQDNGTYHHLENFADLERVLKSDIIARKELILDKGEKVLMDVIQKEHDILKGITEVASIRRCNRTSPKNMANVLLGAGKSPLLVIGNFGKGKSAALTTQINSEWAGELTKWDKLSTIITGLISYIQKPAFGDDVQAKYEIEGNSLKIIATVKRGIDFINGLDLSATYRNTRTSEYGNIQFKQIGSGKYEGVIVNVSQGAYYISLISPKSQSPTLIANVPYNREFYNIGINMQLLDEISSDTGGKVLMRLDEHRDKPRKNIPIEKDGRPYFIAVAIILFFIDLLIATFWK